MEVIVKSSPKIEIELATKVVNVGGKVTVDSALSTESENPVQNKVITEELGKKADKEGNYPLLHVGTADDLAGRGESVPAEFGFRASGGKSIKDGRAYLKRIKGNSVVWNQLRGSANRQSLEASKGGISIQFNKGETLQNITGTYEGFEGDASWYNAGAFNDIKGIIGHKYLCSIRGNKNTRMTIYGYGGPSIMRIKDSVIITAETATKISIVPCIDTSMAIGTVVNENIFFLCHDLTQMFGTGNEPTTIEDFQSRVATLGVDMNAYKEGQVIHCNTESIKSVGDNAWDEEWEVGSYNPDTGKPQNSTTIIRSVNFINVLPNASYYIKTPASIGTKSNLRVYYYDNSNNYLGCSIWLRNDPSIITTPTNCAYITFVIAGTTSYDHDIMISLVHSGWKAEVDNTYKPYWQDTLPLPIIRKYFSDGMKSAGSAHDEIRFNKASGKWEAVQRIGSVDMGTLIWNYIGVSDSNPYGRLSASLPSRKIGKGNLLCSVYSSKGPSYSTDKNIFGAGSAATIIVIDSAYTDAASFKAAMQGVILYYESNDWEWVELDEADQNFRDYYNVADFGTEMSQSAVAVPSAPFSADIIYQFNAVDMIREHELEITELQSIITEQQSVIATMQAQLTSLINGGQ